MTSFSPISLAACILLAVGAVAIMVFMMRRDSLAPPPDGDSKTNSDVINDAFREAIKQKQENGTARPDQGAETEDPNH